MADTITPGDAAEYRDLVHRIVQILSDGGAVGLPTEAGYLPVRLLSHPSTGDVAGDRRLLILFRSVSESLDYVQPNSRNTSKLMRRLWPGPVILDLARSELRCGLLSAVPDRVVERVARNRFWSTVSSEPRIHDVARLVSGPLVAEWTGAVHDTADACSSAEEVQFVVNVGPVRFAKGHTIISVEQGEVAVTREGAVGPDSANRMTSEVILFVCTGNTCRSPMAEGLFRSMLARRLNCAPDQLQDRGYLVSSAGLAAAYGSPASPESVQLLSDREIDITTHSSQPLTERLLEHADLIFTMTRGHRNAILSSRPDMADRVRVLSPDGGDVSDPIGGGMDEYERCLASIEAYLEHILSELPLPPAPT